MVPEMSRTGLDTRGPAYSMRRRRIGGAISAYVRAMAAHPFKDVDDDDDDDDGGGGESQLSGFHV